ncbi:MAG TPA: immunoglobulin domain-containing protein [Verrucomicrobiota bacterium]|nr:hypothetical protein [Verrucomicrobiales bacterium]HRI14182.1 immunoglobulin domain-containing protein [Verrucomicrobiota bacterium]
MNAFYRQAIRHRGQPPPLRWATFLAICVLCFARAPAQELLSVDAGGGRSYGSGITNDATIGGVAGVASVVSSATPLAVNRAGYLGQLTEVTKLNLIGSPQVLHPFEATQLSGTAELDDGSIGELLGSEILWEAARYPIVSLTSDGRAQATGLITSNMFAQISGSFRGIPSTTVFLLVSAFPPRIRTAPVDQTATVGGTVDLEVAADGDQPLAYQWYWNDLIISGATNRVLRLSRLEESSSGPYTVAIANEFGFASATAVVTVLPATTPPTITSPNGPVTVSVDIDGDVTLTVEANGTAPLSFQWQLNGENLSDRLDGSQPGDLTARGELRGATTSTLTLSRLRLADAGTYRVVVQNGLRADVSPDFTLSFAGLGVLPFTTNQPPFLIPVLSADVGTGVSLQRLAEPVWIRWRPSTAGYATIATAGSGFDTLLEVVVVDGAGTTKTLAKDDDSGGFHTSLVGFNATPNDYYVKVAGYANATGDIQLQWKLQPSILLPEFGAGPSSVVVPLDEFGNFLPTDVVLTATVTNANAPQTTFSWFRNGEPLGAAVSNDLPVYTFTLPLRNVSISDIGHYQLVAFQGSHRLEVASEIASLEGSTEANLLASPKLEALFEETSLGNRSIHELRLDPLAAEIARLLQSETRVGRASFSVGQGVVGSSVVNNSNAGTQNTDPVLNSSQVYNTLWYKVTSTEDSETIFRATSSRTNAYLDIINSSRKVLGFDVAPKPNPYGNRPSLVLSAKKGEDYYLRVGSVETNSETIKIEWTNFIPGFQWVEFGPVGQNQSITINYIDSGISNVLSVFQTKAGTSVSQAKELATEYVKHTTNETRFSALKDYRYWVGAVAGSSNKVQLAWAPSMSFQLTNGVFRLTWGESADRSFAVEAFSDNGLPVSPLEGSYSQDGLARTFEVTPSNSPRYYRLVPETP